MRLQSHCVLRQAHAYAPILLVRKDRCTLQRSTQSISLDHHCLAGTCRDYAPIIRKLAINQFRSESNVADLEANMVRSDGDLHITFSVENSLQFQDSLTRNNDLLRLD